MKTTIIIPTYNNEEYTLRCLQSIGSTTDEFLIIWVDDASTPASIEKVQSFLDGKKIPYELIAKKENTGFAASVNLGLSRSLELDAQYIVLQNNDTEVYPGWLNRLIEVAETDKKIGAVGPLTSPCESWQSIINLRKEFSQFAALPEYHDNPAEYAALISARYANEHVLVYKRLAFFSVLFRADIIREIGMLSEEYGIGFGEDDDYMLRLRQKGYYGALAKDVFVFHNHNTTFKSKYSAQEVQEMREHNRDLLYRKFEKGRYRPQNIEELWDIEEAITYAKQLEERIKSKVKDLKESRAQLLDKEATIERLVTRMREKEKELASMAREIEEKDKDVQELKAQNNTLCEELERYKLKLKVIHQSYTWRLTRPLRAWKSLLESKRK